MSREPKVQTNLRLSAARAAALDIASALEGKDKAEIVEEALQLRQALMGSEYRAALDAALAVRDQHEAGSRLQEIEQIREEIAEEVDRGTMSVSDVIERIEERRQDEAFRNRLTASVERNRRILDRLAQ